VKKQGKRKELPKKELERERIKEGRKKLDSNRER
jgi:hypothetical protein